jgi:hypothetical protein
MGTNLSRRQALGLGAAALTGGAFAASSTTPALGEPHPDGDISVMAYCADPSTLATHTAIGGATLYSEAGSPATVKINEAFFQRLYQWRFFYNDNNPWSLLTQFRHLGAYVNRNDGCVSWHNAGRAIDVTRGYGTDTGNTLQFFFRYDLWRNYASATMQLHRRRYWAAVASLHHYFEYVLTYLYNTAHYNHVHVDNSQSGTGYSTFGTGSGTQVESVQAMLSYVWGYATTIDGIWGSQTDGNSARVLSRIGTGGRLTSGQSYWLAFLRATCRKGTGLQAY